MTKVKYKKLTEDEARDIEHRCYKRFEQSSKLRREFRSKETYAAYIKAQWQGLIRER